MAYTPALWVSGNLEQGLWQAEKHLTCFQSWYDRARRSAPVLHLFPVAFRYAQPNLFIQGSLAPLVCGCPYRQTDRELFTSSHTHPHTGVEGCGQADARRDRSFRSTASPKEFRQTLRKIIFWNPKARPIIYHPLQFKCAVGWVRWGIQVYGTKV